MQNSSTATHRHHTATATASPQHPLARRHRLRAVAHCGADSTVGAGTVIGSAPFNLIQAFNRYDAGSDGLNCVLTVTRGRVCSQLSPLADE